MGYRSNQAIEFGENLLDFARSDVDTEMATRIIPYGAKDETTGLRLTIESVNNGLDYIEDAKAIATRSTVAVPVVWDDVTNPDNLLKKAQKYLESSKMQVTTLTLSAVDLSALNQDIDALHVGDWVRVTSKPHNVNEDFLLRERTYDLLNPANDLVTLGKEQASLTGATTGANWDALKQLNIIRSDYTLNIAQAVEKTSLQLSSLIQQTEESIMLEVSKTYVTGDDVESRVSTKFLQLEDSFNFEFENLSKIVSENGDAARDEFALIRKYIRFEDGDIVLGETGNELVLRIENDRISFRDGGAEVAYFSNKQLYVTDGRFLNSLRVGNFALTPRENKNLSLVKVGD
jgi:hypothetical protein